MIKDFLSAVARLAPKSQEAAYLELGHEFSQEPLSDLDMEDLLNQVKWLGPFRPGECYMNAGRIALNNITDDLVFCEGFASGIFAVPHAWVAFKGRAIDVTWAISWEKPKAYAAAKTRSEIRDRISLNIARSSYFGVEVPTNVFRAHVFKCKRWSPLFDPRFYKQWPKFKMIVAGKKFAMLSQRGNKK